jgi:hypothetical protein
MEAVKFLRPGRVGPFSGVTWPAPGVWLESPAPPELCRAGVHAILPDVLATWLAEELWRVELDGATTPTRGVVVALRGRLLNRVEAWNDESAREYARTCTARVRERAMGRAAEYAADAAAAAETAAAGESAALVAYMAAHAAEAMTPGSFAAERRWQSQWLAQRLGVTDADSSKTATHDGR